MDGTQRSTAAGRAVSAAAALCPACGARGRPVPATTLRHLVVDPPVADPDGWLFCATPSCDAAYYNAREQSVSASAVAVPIFQKRADENRPVCYCFDHAVADVLAATGVDGENTVLDAITQACREGRDHCEEANPQGRCCLGNVRSLLRAPPVRTCSPCACEE